MSVMNSQVTFLSNVKETKLLHYQSVGLALSRIRSGKSASLVEQVRAGDKAAKLKLPVVLFSGIFKERRDDMLFEHSGLIVLDFDKVEDIDEARSRLGTDQYVFAMWVSPSGNGIKLLVKIKFPERHRDQFRALAGYFDKQYGLEADPTGANESRACFESHDPDIIVNENSVIFTALLTEQAQEFKEKERGEVLTDYRKLAIPVKMIATAVDGEKHTALRNAAVLCGGYIAAGRLEEDEVVRVLTREIQKRDIDSLESAKMTIRDGLEFGKRMPINEVIDQENQAIKDVDLEEMDMSFLSSDDDDYIWIEKYSTGQIQPGLNTGNEHFDQYFRYKKELLIANGHSNVGKTTVMLYMIINSVIRHNWKWVLYSAENKTALLKVRLMEFLVGRKVESMTTPERKLAFKWVQEHFTIISNHDIYSFKDLILMCEKLRRSQRVDGFLVDPYNALRINMSGSNALSTHEYHYEAISEFLTYATAHDIAVWINMHAITEAQRRKDENGMTLPPYAEDTEGGGRNVNRADTFITIHRRIQAMDPLERRTVEIHVRKVRTQELGGEPTPHDSPLLLRMDESRTGFHALQGQNLYRPQFLERAQQFQQPNLDITDIQSTFDIAF
jgi:hypothetical protein